jgi:PPOX class probable FMN-dependent enzyme
MDASPRGGDPGFVKVIEDRTLLIPDSPGNNRLDTLTNILSTHQIGLIFIIPGVDETLRINGRAELIDDPALLEYCKDSRRIPKLVIQVAIRDVYLHCAKAFMRSSLWDSTKQVERSTLPSLAKMVYDQLGISETAESQADMVARYKKTL